ncbi:NAD(P)H-quinone oxidoreductase subunit 5 [Acrasis kona]|uniref:NAD(P)H-quinone oxidoreductase subunit 5 n=1 Tax=Acrasis kona TaxID=1008807 RepID=A0AAW2YSK1_9EUKA
MLLQILTAGAVKVKSPSISPGIHAGECKVSPGSTTAGHTNSCKKVDSILPVQDITLEKFDGEMKIRNITIKDSKTSNVIKIENQGKLLGDGSGFLMLSCKSPRDDTSNLKKNQSFVVELVNDQGVQINKVRMMFDKVAFGNSVFVRN